MKKKLLIAFIALIVIAGIGGALGSDEEPENAATEEVTEEIDTKEIIVKHFEDNRFMEVDDVFSDEVHITCEGSDQEAVEAGISLYSNTLAQKLSDHTDTLTLIYALPKLNNVLEVKYEKQGGELVQVKWEYDI